MSISPNNSNTVYGLNLTGITCSVALLLAAIRLGKGTYAFPYAAFFVMAGAINHHSFPLYNQVPRRITSPQLRTVADLSIGSCSWILSAGIMQGAYKATRSFSWCYIDKRAALALASAQEVFFYFNRSYLQKLEELDRRKS